MPVERPQPLEQRVRLLRDLLEALSEGVSVVGLNGKIRYANRAMRESLGLETERVDTVFDALARLFPEPVDATRAARHWAEYLQRGQAAEHTARIQRPDGQQRHLSFRLSPLGEDGVLLRAVDVTREHEEREARNFLEEQLLQAQKMEAVGTLAGGVAHDMNNILGVIMGFGSVLQQSDVGGSTRVKCINGILAAARRGRDLTGNLLGFARKGSFTSSRVQVNDLVREVRDLLSGTTPKGIRITLQLSPDLVEVDGDPSQLHQALFNICLNAVEAIGERGEVSISTANHSIPGDSLESWANITPGRFARITVTDDGPGMDRQTISRAFEPFFTTKPKGRGTGLGLSMVYGTVMHHKGDIRISSRPDEGTRVTLLLPEAASKEQFAYLPPACRAEPRISAPAGVLLVDDEELVLQSGKVLLETLGHKVWLASGGNEAIQHFRHHQSSVDLVILDLLMPDLDGADTFRLLKRIRSNVKVLLCSGYPKEREVEALVAEGATGFIRKPFELDRLAREINRVMVEQPV
ncbi:MAG: ATP-binding protein [Polyangia bacterium]|nr:ATP-binding protein [Polyangia bacterium]